jgi:hypothetical protein
MSSSPMVRGPSTFCRKIEAYELFVKHFNDIYLGSDIDLETHSDEDGDVGVLGQLL